ncbi:O-glucosyltransferase rumi-like protein [Colletotrichum chlorophyti]|uniref:O-glucosyltransferase rumi-like protein n=1 Tax=Colletotrichum chlorophyti TaxID=708187 RepID=A0A1Q8RNV1_9PEZI|nr:O-glucosyltransferase rumi-like protein [Colletotrichum chlorophyti]
MRSQRVTRRLWSVLVVSTFGVIIYVLFRPLRSLRGRPPGSPSGYQAESNLRAGNTDFKNLRLTEGECQSAFPGLTSEIDRAVAEGEFRLNVSDAYTSLLGEIKENKILIHRAPRPVDMSEQWIQRQSAALHQLNRALLTSPTLLPDTIFNLYIQDVPVPNSWSHSRPATPPSSPRHIFPIPHFSFWAWDQPFIRSIPHAAAAIATLEASLPFEGKDPRAIWRGTTWFNNPASANPRSRQDLLLKTKGAAWADVQALTWTSNSQDAGNVVAIEDFCRYKYVIYTEGVSYSGRLQFHQLCESVLLTPPFEWMQHTTHLVKPVYSSTLLGSEAKSDGFPSPRALEAWPDTAGAEEADVVFVRPDWSDLEATIQWLEGHPEVARGIARRQREKFAGQGYLSPGAEVCYWRSLIRGWSTVVRSDEDGLGDGVSFEEFTVKSGGSRKGR